MAQVRIRKALQIKNRISGEVANLTKLIQANNSHQKGGSRFDVNDLIKSRASAVEKLIAVKAALAVSNVAIYGKIARMAELKSEIQMYRTLPTNEGCTEAGYGDRAKTIVIECTVNAVQVEERVKELTLEIEKLQDEVDYFNSTTEITIPD